MEIVFDVLILLSFFSITIFGRCPDHSQETLCSSCENNTAECSHRCIGNSPYSKNYLTQICPGEGKEIYNIDLSFNELIRFECSVDGSSVKYLNISHNNIRFDSCSNWEMYCENFFRRLRTIDLSYNRIQQTCNASAFPFSKLENANLSHNEIKSLDNLPFVTSAKRLQTLDVSHNMITCIPSTFFIERQSLIKVDLRFNSFQKIALHFHISDQRLCDSDNQLSIILSSDILSKLDVSLIYENNLTCPELKNQPLCNDIAEDFYDNSDNKSCNLMSEIIKTAITPSNLEYQMECRCQGNICEQNVSTILQPTSTVSCISTNAPIMTTDKAIEKGTTFSLFPQSYETSETNPVLTNTKELELGERSSQSPTQTALLIDEMLIYIMLIAAAVLLTCIFCICLIKSLSQIATTYFRYKSRVIEQGVTNNERPKLPNRYFSFGNSQPKTESHETQSSIIHIYESSDFEQHDKIVTSSNKPIESCTNTNEDPITEWHSYERCIKEKSLHPNEQLKDVNIESNLFNKQDTLVEIHPVHEFQEPPSYGFTLSKTPSKSHNEPVTTFSDAHVYEYTIIKTSSSDTELKPTDIHTEFDKAVTSCGEPKDGHIYEHNRMKTSSSDTELKSADIHREYDKPVTSLSEPKDAHVYEYTIIKTSSSDTEVKLRDFDQEFDKPVTSLSEPKDAHFYEYEEAFL
ncbi:uncharacterized protein [Apostichopus japonicus]|uniref:uncharacterized protein isoform X2 n=1 Tax=Stichopus japonicus TaxID=307972 RepID=UPI003AB8E352